MPAIVARSVIASRNSDPPSENLTNTALLAQLFSTHCRLKIINIDGSLVYMMRGAMSLVIDILMYRDDRRMLTTSDRVCQLLNLTPVLLTAHLGVGIVEW